MNTLLLAGLLAAFASAPAGAQPVQGDARPEDVPPQADSLAADSLTADPAAADSTASFLTPQGVEVVVLADSAQQAELDSAAVAALADTAYVLPPGLSEGVPVTFFGRTIFRVYSPIGPYSAEERAERLTARLEALSANPNADMERLRVVEGVSFTTIQLGDLIVMTVTEDDAQALMVPRSRAALGYVEQIQEAVERHREQLSLRGLARSAGFAVLLTLLFVLIFRSLGAFFRWVDRRTAPLRRKAVRPIVVGGNVLVGRDQIAQAGLMVARAMRLAVILILAYLYLTSLFGLFPWTQAWSERLLSYAVAPLAALGTMVIEGAPNLLAIAVIVVVIRLLIRFSNSVFRGVEAGTFNLGTFPEELAEPTRKIVVFLLVILGVMLVYPYTPIADSPVFQGLTVFLGILFSLGSSSAISNMVAGIVLTYTRAFRIGDRVKVGDTFGDVVEKSFLVTRILTPKNEDVAVPNSMVLSNHIVNYSRMSREGNGVVLHTTVTIGYDVPWPRVHDLLTSAARATEGVEPVPPPFVLQTSLGDFSVAYQLNAYTHAVQRMSGLYSDLHAHIQDAFAEAGVEILSPVYEAQRDGSSLTIPEGLLENRLDRREVGDGGPVVEPRSDAEPADGAGA